MTNENIKDKFEPVDITQKSIACSSPCEEDQNNEE